MLWDIVLFISEVPLFVIHEPLVPVVVPVMVPRTVSQAGDLETVPLHQVDDELQPWSQPFHLFCKYAQYLSLPFHVPSSSS